jgi:hypothetical protein
MDELVERVVCHPRRVDAFGLVFDTERGDVRQLHTVTLKAATDTRMLGICVTSHPPGPP